MPTETIILVHGLWMTGYELGWLKHQFEDAGYRCVRFSYASVTGEMHEHVADLQAVARAQRGQRVHFVAHSLGGVVVFHCLEQARDLLPGRAVLLGSPVNGSRAAQVVASSELGRLAVGESALSALMTPRPRRWDGRRDIGVIAGSENIGLGRLIAEELKQDSDGTVLVSETRLAGAADHLVLPVSHTGMLFDTEVARQTMLFLRRGRFDHVPS